MYGFYGKVLAPKVHLVESMGVQVQLTIAVSIAWLSHLAFARLPIPEPSSFSFEDLQETIRLNNVKSIEGLLPHLPESFRSRAVLMHTSGSLQGANYEFPRVIMFGEVEYGFDKGVQMVIAFNGSPEVASENSSPANFNGFYDLEIIQWREEKKEFEFREIKFSPDRNSDPLISEANPKKCASCHTEHFTPLWHVYPIWPGAYNSAVSGHSFIDESGRLIITDDSDPRAIKEAKEFEKFRESYKNHPRYKHFTGIGRTQSGGSIGHVATLTDGLFRQNFKRIIKELRGFPFYEQYRDLILAIFSRCADSSAEGFLDFFPESLRTPELIAQTRKIYEHTFEHDGKRPADSGRLLEAVVNSAGVDVSHWFTVPNRRQLDEFVEDKSSDSVPVEGEPKFYSSLMFTSGTFEYEFFLSLLTSDRQLFDEHKHRLKLYDGGKRFHWDSYDGRNHEEVCAYLKNRVRARLEQAASKASCESVRGKIESPREILDGMEASQLLERQIEEEAIDSGKKAIERNCIGCHTGNGSGPPDPKSSAPSIDFNRLDSNLIEKIKKRVMSKGNTRMPPDGMSPEERSAIVDYVDLIQSK